jgi:hypothetical protein
MRRRTLLSGLAADRVAAFRLFVAENSGGAMDTSGTKEDMEGS